jgi:hypothetical protein
MTKAQLAREKAKASEILVDQSSLVAEEKQETYYKMIMPKLMDVCWLFFFSYFSSEDRVFQCNLIHSFFFFVEISSS